MLSVERVAVEESSQTLLVVEALRRFVGRMTKRRRCFSVLRVKASPEVSFVLSRSRCIRETWAHNLRTGRRRRLLRLAIVSRVDNDCHCD